MVKLRANIVKDKSIVVSGKFDENLETEEKVIEQFKIK
jgi:hypothetical protein